MNSRFSSVIRSSGVTLALAVCFPLLAAQSAPAKPAPEPSFFESYGLYLGVAAIISLVIVAVLLRKKAAQAARIILPRGDGLKLTYKEKAAAMPMPPKPEFAQPEPKKSGPENLPVFSFNKLQRTNYYLQLPESRDAALMQAIDVTNEDSDADAAERTQALKLMSTFKTSNSVAAIAQTALYDLSSKLRSDAVTMLAEIDHESVFEAVVTACADPTREVRAAGAKALFKLTFDRAHAWARIIETGDIARMRHAARCAIEGDLVTRSFDRLIHADRKIAYEAFALTALLIRAGETEPIYKTLATHRDEKVKLALLHVLETIKEDQTFEELSDLLTRENLTPNVAAKVNEVRSCLQLTHA